MTTATAGRLARIVCWSPHYRRRIGAQDILWRALGEEGACNALKGYTCTPIVSYK